MKSKFRLYCLILGISINNLANGVGSSDLHISKRLEQKNNSELNVSGDIIVGIDNYSDFYSTEGESSSNNVFLRRAKLALDYGFSKDWEYQLDLLLEEKDNEFEFDIGDSIISYRGLSAMTVKLGHLKEPFGFERLTGLNKQISNERSQVSQAFAPGRNYGISLEHNDKAMTWAIGYFQDKMDSSETQALTGRITYTPMLTENQVIHLGLSASSRDLNQSIYQVRQSAEVYSADNIARSAQFIADSSQLIGSELFINYASFGLAAEYITEKVKQSQGTDWNFDGFYVQLSYFLSGEKLKYKQGKLKSIKPSGRTGAWQLIARYSHTNLRDNLLGSESNVGLLGVNYYWSKNLLFKLNYLKPEISGNTLNTESDGSAVSMRMQYRF